MKKEMTILTEMRYRRSPTLFISEYCVRYTRYPMLYIIEYCLSEMKAYTLYVAVNTDTVCGDNVYS